METKTNVTFTWENHVVIGSIEREYENSFLVQVDEPSKEIMEKFSGRMVVSKKICEIISE